MDNVFLNKEYLTPNSFLDYAFVHTVIRQFIGIYKRQSLFRSLFIKKNDFFLLPVKCLVNINLGVSGARSTQKRRTFFEVDQASICFTAVFLRQACQ